MIDIVRYKTDRAVCKRKLNSPRMRAPKPAHIPPATRDSRGRHTRCIILPIEVDCYAGDCPVTLTVPGHTVAIYGRGFADEHRMTCAVCNLLHFHAATRVSHAP